MRGWVRPAPVVERVRLGCQTCGERFEGSEKHSRARAQWLASGPRVGA